MNKRPIRLMVLLWLLLSFAQTARSEEAKLFSLNFKDVDIRALIETVADATGKNFVIDPRITGNITVVTSTPMRASQVYDVFLSILKVHGFAAVTTGGIIKIVPTQSAKQDGDPGELKQIIRGGDEQQTRIVQLHHVDAGQLVQTLLPLMPQYAFLAAVPESNNLIISDTAANVARLEAMVSQVDKSDAQVLEVIQLQHASAADLIQPINNLIATINAGKATATAPPMVADERTNSIIIGGHPDTRLQMRTLIASLDGPIEKDGNTEVIYLRFAKAKEMVETLTGVGSAKDDKAEKPKTKASTDKNFDIRADEAINALIITAPSDVMRNLKQVIRQLDIRRAQVHIEAIIAEVTYDKLQQLGVEWQTDIDGPGGIVAGRTRGGRDSLDLAAFATSLGKGMNIGYLAGSELKALINAFASNTNVNILSTPSLVTLDNEEASIMVGENIPLTTGQFAPAPGINQPFNTIQRQDVGIKLKVLPQINEGDAVKLKVTQEVSSVTGPERFTKRQIETSVLVDDGRILVMGGLIEDKVNETVDSVPLLGDIPLLGYLFRTTNTSVKKTNLMVFLRPQIIRDTRQSGEVTQDKYHAIREKQQKFIEEGLHLMPDEPQPLLESLPDAGGDEASVGQP